MALYSPAYNAHVGKHFIIQVSLAQGGGEMANGELLRTTQLILLWEDYTIHWTGDPTTTLQMCCTVAYFWTIYTIHKQSFHNNIPLWHIFTWTFQDSQWYSEKHITYKLLTLHTLFNTSTTNYNYKDAWLSLKVKHCWLTLEHWPRRRITQIETDHVIRRSPSPKKLSCTWNIWDLFRKSIKS